MKILKTSILLSLIALSACTAETGEDLQLDVFPVNSQQIGEYNLVSSTQLELQWFPVNVDHYELHITDMLSSTTEKERVEAEKSNYLVTGLKASTDYLFALQACGNEDCTTLLAQDTIQVKTQEEYWQLQGSGNSFEELAPVIEDGNTLAYVMQVGDELSLYSTSRPMLSAGAGYQVHTRTFSDNLADYFNWTGPTYFLQNACQPEFQKNPTNPTPQCPEGSFEFFAFQMIPLEEKEAVLLCFEAHQNDTAKTTQIYCMENHDGYTGIDFNAAPDLENCGQDDDYTEGGNCEFEMVSRDFGLIHARQFKIGFPKRDSDYWDQSPGTFMVITGADECEQTEDGLFYAQWDGETWNAVKDEEGCAQRLVDNGHGPVLVHLEEDHYKLYYEEIELEAGEKRHDGILKGKPFRMIYSDGTGFEDWESHELGREVHFLWPDGSMLSVQEEAGLGDHMIFLPTNELDWQLMVYNMNGHDNNDSPSSSQGLGMAVLMNP